MKQIDRINNNYYNAQGQKEFYKGTSFRVHKGSPDSYYFNNEEYVDGVIFNGALCICSRTHVSNMDNAPVLIYKQGVPIDIEQNPCGEFALGGLAFTEDSPLADPTRIKLENNALYISNNEGVTWNYVGTIITEETPTNVTASVTSVQESDQVSADVSVTNGNHLQFSFSIPRGKNGTDGKDGINGTNGIDGNGFDYIFCLTETPDFDKLDPTTLEPVQDDNYTPDGGYNYTQQVNETMEYQGVSTRKKINGIGGKYSSPVILNSYVTEGIIPEVSFTSFIFTRTNAIFDSSQDQLPEGGNYNSPYPTSSGTIGGSAVVGTDSIPEGTHQVGMSSRVFSTKDNTSNGSVPRVLTDTANFQVEYSKELVYLEPTHLQSYYDADMANFEKNWRADNTTWTDEGTDAIWMATATMHNGVGSDGTINKIKGEDGNDGTPINVIGEVASFEDIPLCGEYNGNHGDAYIVTSYEGQSKVMFVYTGDDTNCGLNIGPLAVQGAFLHIKYAKTLYDGTDTWDGGSDNGGETPDDYIGIYWDSVEDDSTDPSRYTGNKGTGDDGGGYEYIYQANNTGIAPTVPTDSEQINGYIPSGWYDDPVNISVDLQYCWMCYRRKVNNIGSNGIGAKDSTNAALWSRWGQDGETGPEGPAGEDGASVEYIFARSIVDTVSFSDSGLTLPENSGEYDNPSTPWTDNPQGISLDYPVEGVCERIKPQGSSTGSEWSTPAVFARYGYDGATRTLVKIGKRTNKEITVDDINAPTHAAVYDINTGMVSLVSGSENGGSASGILTGGRFLYSLGAHVTYNDTNVNIQPEDWTVLTLESVDGENGQDGTGQSAAIITVDPDSILVNVDNNNKVRIALNVSCTANYYYGTALQNSTFSYTAPSGITITEDEVENSEHVFFINVPTGFELQNSIPITITLTPNTTALENSDNSITELSPLSKKIYLNPVKSNDTGGIDLSTDQIVDHDGLDITITANIIKNDTIYAGSDAQLTYLGGSNPEEEFPTGGLKITHDMVDDTANEIIVILKVNNQSILHQSISILRNGGQGEQGVSIENIGEYYLGSSDGNDVDGFDETYFIGSTVITPGQNVVTTDYTTGTAGKPEVFNPMKPYLGNIELIKYTNGEFQTTLPALISKSGKGIESITEGYLVSELKSGIVFTHNNGVPDDSNWKNEYDQTQLTENQVVGNVEVIKYDDGTYFATNPVIIGMYSKGEDGQSISDIYEYYIYVEKDVEPVPNWDEYTINGTLKNTDGTEGTKETVPTLPTGKPCLGNVEVIAYKDPGDGYSHTNPVLISNRLMEIASVDEYYLATSKAEGVSFTINNYTEGTLVGPNEPVPVTDEVNMYLWNAELITYADGHQNYLLPARIGVYIKGNNGEDAGPVYSLMLDRYSENPFYVVQVENMQGLDNIYKFEGSFRKDNVILAKDSYYIDLDASNVSLFEHTSSYFKLKLNDVVTSEFIATILLKDVNTDKTLLEVPITFTPIEAQLTVSLSSDTINLGRRKTEYSESWTYSGNSDTVYLKTYINDKEIDSKLIDLSINIDEITEELKPILQDIQVINNMVNGILLDYKAYYKYYLDKNPGLQDIIACVESGQLTSIPLIARYQQSSLNIQITVKLTTALLNPEYLKITTDPNVILPSDTDSQIRVRVHSLNDSYITASELNDWPYKLQYNIDNSDTWTTVTSEHKFSMGYFLWPKQDILINIQFRIVDINESIVYVQETVERAGIDSTIDYFNGLPNILECPKTYQLDTNAFYEFTPSIASYTPETGDFRINKFSSPFISIVRYSSDNLETRQILAQKTFAIKYLNIIEADSTIISSGELPYTIESCGDYTELGPKYVSVFNLTPGFTTIVDNAVRPSDYQLHIPYFGSNETHNLGEEITENILNDLYGLVGKTFNIKFKYSNINVDDSASVFGTYFRDTLDGIQCSAATLNGSIVDVTTNPIYYGILIKVEYNSIIKDDGTVAVIPSISYKSSQPQS